MAGFRLQYDDDLLDVVDKVNDALADMEVRFEYDNTAPDTGPHVDFFLVSLATGDRL